MQKRRVTVTLELETNINLIKLASRKFWDDIVSEAEIDADEKRDRTRVIQAQANVIQESKD